MSTTTPDHEVHRRESPIILPLLLVVLVVGGAAHRLTQVNELALTEAERLVESRARTILEFPQQFALVGRSITRARLEDVRDRGVLAGPDFLFASSWRRRENGIRTRAGIALIMLAAVQGDIAGMPRDLAALKQRGQVIGGQPTEDEELLVLQARVVLSGLKNVPGRQAREDLLRLYREALVVRAVPTQFLEPEVLEARVRAHLGREKVPEPEPEPEETWEPEPYPVAEPEPEPEPESEPEASASPAAPTTPTTDETLVLPEITGPWDPGLHELLPPLEPVSHSLEPPTTAP